MYVNTYRRPLTSNPWPLSMIEYLINL